MSSHPSRVMSIAQLFAEDLIPDPKMGRMEIQPALSFSNEDKVRTLQLTWASGRWLKSPAEGSGD